MNIKENIGHLLKQIPDNVKLVAVSKTKSIEEILEGPQGWPANFWGKQSSRNER